MTFSRRSVLALVTSMIAVASFATAQPLPTTGLRLWLRADTLVTHSVPTDTSSAVSTWASIVGGYICVAADGSALLRRTINGRPAIFFNGTSYLRAPAVFPAQRDYTVYVVVEWNGVNAANNMVSGQSRALYTSSPGTPTVLHNGDFSRMSISAMAMSGPTVLRVRHAHATGATTIALNNRETSSDVVPPNSDTVIYIGAYQQGNTFNGTMAEILIYEKALTSQEHASVEAYLHARYAIKRAPDPVPPAVRFLQAPRQLEVVEPGSTLRLEGIVESDTIVDASFIVRRDDVVVHTHNVRGLRQGSIVRDSFVVDGELASWSVTVTTRSARSSVDTVLRVLDIAPGFVFTVNGQSNSIFGDGTLLSSPWARTFGANFSQRASDTAITLSNPTTSGGGSSVGAWPFQLQQAITTQFRQATLCISGGVGGTRIEAHLPDPANRLNLGTIYGSWLYRIIKSGAREKIRWLFWYQGESNSSSDDYVALFDTLRRAWKNDLPNLTTIVVVQIRPGCGGPGHAELRDEQRRLQDLYPDVIVHAASGLPGHDGCHYYGVGYTTLAQQLFELYRRTELSMQPGRVHLSPTIDQATSGPDSVVRVRFRHTDQLMMSSDIIVNGARRGAVDAWFANDVPTLHPRSVDVQGSTVTLVFPRAVTRISYVPDYAYDDATSIYQGPWLVTAGGIGALSFHNVPVVPTSVEEAQQVDVAENGEFTVYDLTGRYIGDSTADLPAGAYICWSRTGTRKILISR